MNTLESGTAGGQHAMIELSSSKVLLELQLL